MKNRLINKVTFRSPLGDKEFEEYDLFRWKVLRKPIGKTIETLKDKFDKDSFHIIGLYNKVIIASGRVHLIMMMKLKLDIWRLIMLLEQKV